MRLTRMLKKKHRTGLLRRSANEQIVETHPESVIAVDTQGSVLVFNLAASDIFGFAQRDVLGRSLRILAPDRLSEEYMSRLDACVSAGVQVEASGTPYDVIGRHSDGTEIPLTVLPSILGVEEHAVIIIIVIDPAELVAADLLGQEFAESRLRLIESLSHELRTPLSAMLGFAKLLQARDSELSPADQAELIATVANQGSELSNLIDDLLVVAKSEAESLTLLSVHIDLKSQTTQVIENLHQTDRATITFTGTPVAAIGDGVRVRQIIRNLVSNSLRHGGGQIEIAFGKEGDFATVKVIDNGDGVPDGAKSKIFEPYFGEKRTPGTTGDIGIGLSISKDLAQRMLGDVTYSRLNDKTIFEFRLPAA